MQISKPLHSFLFSQNQIAHFIFPYSLMLSKFNEQKPFIIPYSYCDVIYHFPPVGNLFNHDRTLNYLMERIEKVRRCHLRSENVFHPNSSYSRILLEPCHAPVMTNISDKFSLYNYIWIGSYITYFFSFFYYLTSKNL